MTAAELTRLGDELGLDAIGAAPAAHYEETERHIRERKERGLFATMGFTTRRPEVSCHPEQLLPGARTVISAALCYYADADEPGPGEGTLARYTWSDRYAELREKLDALGRRLGGAYRVLVDENDHVDREGAVAGGRRLLRQEHACDHAAPRLVGRARDARQRPRRRAVRAARRRLRLVHALHRRLPDGRARRAGDARLDALPLLLDAGAGADPGRVPRRARRVRLRLRHLPGRLPVEPRRREAPRGRPAARRRGAGRLAARLARGRRRGARRRATTGSTCRGTIPAGCAGTRSSPRGMSAATLERERRRRVRDGDDELLREHAGWALARIDERSGA